MCGEIQLIIGPMFSGKTTELMRRIRRYAISGKKTAIIKYYADTRYSDNKSLVTHDNFAYNINVISVISLNDANIDDYDIVGIDEGQFFSELYNFCCKNADLGKIIIIAALNGNSNRETFGEVINLVPMAESIKKLNAICLDCGNEATFSHRIVTNNNEVLIGGTESYKPLCRKCYIFANIDN